MRALALASIILLAACSSAPKVATDPTTKEAVQCDLSVDDAIEQAHAVKMTPAQYSSWNAWLADQNVPPPPDGEDIWAYIAPYKDGFSILVSYQGCIITAIEPFTRDELVQMFGQGA